MKYSIKTDSGKKAYMQLYEQLRQDITDQVYKYGEKLPSKRILAEETQTSVITVEHAYLILSDEGYIEAKERSGYFVAYQKDEFVPIADKEVHGVINRGQHYNMSEFPFSVLAKTMRNVISKYGENLLIKSPNAGCIQLRGAIADYLVRSKGMNISYKQVVIGSGAEYLYGLIVQYLGRDKIYALEDPSYEQIHSVYRMNGAECELLNQRSLKNLMQTTQIKICEQFIIINRWLISCHFLRYGWFLIIIFAGIHFSVF